MAEGVNAPSDELVTMMAPRRGHYLLESGHHGDLWLDLDALFVRPNMLRPFVDVLARRLSGYGIEAACGPLTGGAFVAQMVAQYLGIDFHFTERPSTAYAGGYRLAGRPAVAGKRIAVVDDVVNAGSAVDATLRELRARDARPAALGALLALGARAEGLAADEAIPLENVAWMDNTIWAPGDCPMCASGAPLEDLRG